MSRLSSLLRLVKERDPELAGELAREVEALSKRRAFGLNFERHLPETVELPGRPVRKGDKVRFLPPRGETSTDLDHRLWRVASVCKTDEGRVAELIGHKGQDEESERTTRSVEDLVVIAEFRDPIYPGLVSTGSIERGGGKPFHTVINAENYHALQALLYTHEGKVDAIYIDPPYNSRARDWKYNNDYVDPDDAYRHSKWLAMMERRLRLAGRLLKPEAGVLIVTIDEKEYLRLGLLLQQVFQASEIQMVSSLVNPKGTGRTNEFRRVDEYIYFVWHGKATIGKLSASLARASKGASPGRSSGKVGLDWQTFRRRDLASVRHTRPGQFYPIYVSRSTGQIEGAGDPLEPEASVEDAPRREGCVAVFPVRADGTEMNWAITVPSFYRRWRQGYVRAGRATPGKPQEYIIQYLKTGSIADIEEGRAVVTGRNPDGSVEAVYHEETGKMPTTQWQFRSHNAEHYGTRVLNSLLPGRTFPFPKSLFAVEDALRIFLGENRDAIVVDFFAGSGTTAHAVARLNKQDGGMRRSVSVTNNEVSAAEEHRLRREGWRPGDAKWEQFGICEYITKPRIEAAVTGRTPDGTPLDGDYKFTDEFPMAKGFEENVEFFTMTYEAPRSVAHHRDFEVIGPLLWLKAGAQGHRIARAKDGFDIADTYAVLFDLDASRDFLAAVSAADLVQMAFIVTDDDRGFQMVCSELPERVEAVRLYESYLTNFRINAGRE